MDTPNLGLPFLMAAQAQKHVTHNEALRALDALVHLAVIDRDAGEPPEAPADGDRYIVGSDASGAWAGSETQIAAFQDGAWAFFAPQPGWRAWVANETLLVVWNGSAWSPIGGEGEGGGSGAFDTLGVNAAADESNRLAVAAAASLFNHAGNGHQVKVNKNDAADTASFLFQTGFSGRAEMGTAGDDDFHFKVSPDGSAWHEAIVIDKDTGEVAFPSGVDLPGGNMLASVYDPNEVAADAFAMDNMAEGSDAKIMTAAERTKLAGVASGATANSADATLLDRANHTGTQAIATVTGLQTALDGKASGSHNHDGTYQPADSDLSAVAALSPSNDDVLQRKAGAWTNRTLAQLAIDLNLRPRLSGDRTYYVRKDGNNANSGLANNSGGAKLTIMAALNAAAQIDFNGHSVVIQIGDGTYDEHVRVPAMTGQSTVENLKLLGNQSTPGNVVVRNTNGWAPVVEALGPARCVVAAFRVTAPNSGYGLNAAEGGVITVHADMDFGDCTGGYHWYSQSGAVINCFGNYTVSGPANAHWAAGYSGHIYSDRQANFGGASIAFGWAFAGVFGAGHMQINAASFANTGSVTGKRYEAQSCGLIQTFGQGASFLPGNSAGTTTGGGLYQ